MIEAVYQSYFPEDDSQEDECHWHVKAVVHIT